MATWVIVALAAPPSAVADQPPAGSTWSEAFFSSRDGTRLHADVFRPAPAPSGAVLPVMLVVSPYLGTPTPTEPGGPKVLRWYRRLYEQAIAGGYVVVQVSFRGTGASEGCGDFGGPGEQGDVAAAITWAATRPWSTGRVGMVGHSYDGFAAVVGLAQRPPELAAAVLMAPAVDLYRGVFMNGVGYTQSPAIGAYYEGLALVPPLDLAQAAASDPACPTDLGAQARDPDPRTAFWRERDVSHRAYGTTVPVLWAHGFLDGRDDFSAVRPDNFLDVWRRLAGPRRAWFGQFPHVVPGERNTWNEPEPVGRDGFVGDAVGWLDAHVKRDGAARAAVAAAPEVVVQDGADGGWRAERSWPPAGVRTAPLSLRDGAYTDAAGTKAEQGNDLGGGCAEGIHARCNPFSRTGQGTWTFSQSLPADLHLTGPARINVTLRPQAAGARVVALVYDVDRDGRAALLTRGASLIPESGLVAFDLYPQDWRLHAGHRIGVLLSGSDDFYFAPGTTGARVDVVGGTLSLPLVGPGGGAALAGGPSRAVLERTTFPVDPETMRERSSTLAVPADLQCPGAGCPVAIRLTRRCTDGGRLRVALRNTGGAVRAVEFKLGRRVVARDARPPFRRVLGRKMLARTGARKLSAVVHLRAGAPAPRLLTRSLPRCDRAAGRQPTSRRRPAFTG